MKKYFLPLSELFISIFLFNGCVAVLLGAGVAGGIVVSQDKIQMQVDANYDKAFQTVHTTLSRLGIINSEDAKGGNIEATVQESHVIARITPQTEQSIRITIKARKNLLPDMDLANKIINDINNQFHNHP